MRAARDPLGAPTPPPPSRPRRYRHAPVPLHFPAEETVPETKTHLELRTALYEILKLSLGARACIGSDQFVYWDPADPGQRIAPDAFVRLGQRDELFDVWKVWERGAPHLAVEIVSRSDAPEAPWEEKLARYRRVGVQELVRFDPRRPADPLRIWDTVEGDLVERELDHARAAESGVLGLWWAVVDDAELGPMLRLARDPDGSDFLPTPREAAEARVRALEEELRRRRG